MAQNQVISESNLINTWNKIQKPVLTVLAIVVIVIAGWFGYKKFIQEPKEESANTALSNVQLAFQQAMFTPSIDTAALKFVLNGNGPSKGALYIIRNYGGTNAANLAQYYAGETYLRLGDYNNAVKYLSDFSTNQKQIQMMAYGSLGDAYSELKKNEQAIDNYKKAASLFEDDEVNASEFLFRAALLSEVSGKTKDAVALYKELKEKFPNSVEGSQADKYLNRLEVQANEN
ncbi:MAG: tetratricopeptide repeat protein [Arachidicoccus sp.]|nr:tetratricopeptide repeat protein [Arachidicoccus sp.]